MQRGYLAVLAVQGLTIHENSSFLPPQTLVYV
jgi:hypothetical protein